MESSILCVERSLSPSSLKDSLILMEALILHIYLLGPLCFLSLRRALFGVFRARLGSWVSNLEDPNTKTMRRFRCLGYILWLALACFRWIEVFFLPFGNWLQIPVLTLSIFPFLPSRGSECPLLRGPRLFLGSVPSSLPLTYLCAPLEGSYIDASFPSLSVGNPLIASRTN